MKQQITLGRITTQEAPSGATEDVVTYLHADHLGSAQTGTRSNGTVAWRQDTSPLAKQSRILPPMITSRALRTISRTKPQASTGVFFPSENYTKCRPAIMIRS